VTERSPLVLLHGVVMSGAVWDPVVPLLREHHDVTTPTALGHAGGEPATIRPALVSHLVDEVERRLDADEIERAHVAGNSLGGWVGVELARRGRALSVTAISPGGFFAEDGVSKAATVRTLRRIALSIKLSSPLGSLPHRFALVRRLGLADVCERGHQVSPVEMTRIVEDLKGCGILDDILTTEETIEPLLELDCPVTIAWAERDRILPLRDCLPVARELVPDARFVILPGVGHVPMYDDASMVADVILRTTGARP
jgi:pimeloyl-ACP methyl ester carboxylesterase